MPTGEIGSSPAGVERGYSLVVLIVAITLLNIGMAAALPFWSSLARQEKEAEAVFRGLQYAEALRVFNVRFGRYPTQLEELIELEPRSIRQLWKDPITGGEFGLLVEIPVPRNRRGQGGRGRQQEPRGEQEVDAEGQAGSELASGDPDSEGNQGGGAGKQVVRLPPVKEGRQIRSASAIRGVYIESEDTPRRNYFEASSYRDWLFTDEVIQLPNAPDGEGILKRARSDWIGLGFPPALQPASSARAPTAGEMPSSGREREQRKREASANGDAGDLDSFDDLED